MKKYANKIFLAMIAIIVVCFVVILYKLVDLLATAF